MNEYEKFLAHHMDRRGTTAFELDKLMFGRGDQTPSRLVTGNTVSLTRSKVPVHDT